MLDPGLIAPPFCLPNHRNHPVHLSQLIGHWVLLYWFPKSDTPGCVLQAVGLNDQLLAFEDHDCRVLGASFDNVQQLATFHKRYHLEFDLLADTGRQVGRVYRVAGDSGDHEYADRVSYLIDPVGRIAWAASVQDVALHAETVLDRLDDLQGRRSPSS